MATTACAILVLSDSIVLVNARLVVIEMTARAVGYVSRCGPVDGFGITKVTLRALQISPVVQRFKYQCCVVEVVGQPCCGVVARVAFFCGYEVPDIFAGGDHTVVTGRAGSQHLRVINGIDRLP